MPNVIPNGHFRGLGLIQKTGEIGGYRNVFVNLVGTHDDMVYPHFGGKIMNPPKGRAKMFAGDLLEYRPKTDGTGKLDPEIYILRTFEVLSADGTTVNIVRDDFRHKPFVGDVLIVAPDTIGGTGTAAKVTEVVATIESGKNVWKLTTDTASGAKANDIMVEADASGKMLVENINGVFDCDTDFFENENVADATADNDEFYKARYQYTPALGGLMWIHKMSPMPKCVLDLNMCNIPNWFHVDWTINGKKIISKN